jgi:O-antigen ligase/Flp pilus assembly protein TadD
LGLLIAAIVLLELLIGGTRLVFSLPAYGLIALASLLAPFSPRRSAVPANLVCLICAGAFFGYVLLRAVFSPVEYLARVDLLTALGALMVYLLTALLLTVPKLRLAVVGTLLLLGLANVLLGAIQYCKGEPIVLWSFLQPADFGLRASGLYICPNHLAGFLEVAVLMGLSLACWSRRRLWLKLVAGYAALMGLVGLLLTGSRGGYLSMVVGLVVFAGVSAVVICGARRERIGPTFAVAGVVLGLLAVGTAWFLSRQYVLQARTAKIVDQTNVRPHLWRAAWEQFKTKPVAGTGSGTYLIYARQLRPPTVLGDPEYAHNDYLQLLAEFGLIGAGLFLVFLASHLWSGWKFLRWFIAGRGAALGALQSDALALNLGALSVVAAYAVHSVFDFNLHIPANTLLLAFVFGVLANPGVDLPFPEMSFRPANYWLRFSLPALGLWMAWAGLPTWPAEWHGEKARIALQEDRYTEAVTLAHKAIARDPTNPYFYLHLGQAQSALAESAAQPQSAGLYTAALEAYQRGLKLFPQERWMWLGAGEALSALGRWAEADGYFRSAVFWDPVSPTIRVSYGAYLCQSGRLDEAEEQYRQSLALWSNPAAVMGLEKVREERKKRNQAR